MKTSVRILMLILAVNLTAFLCFGQTISQKSLQNRQEPVRINKNLLPSGFMAGLQWQKFVRHVRIDKSTHSFTYHIDTAVVYSNDVNPQRFIYFYDSAGNKTTSFIELTANGNWNYVSMDTATYDSVGNQLTLLSKIWSNDSWVNASLSVLTYAVNHNIITQVNKVWTNNSWEPTDSSHNTYDFNGNKVASFLANWNDSTWVSNSFNLYSYDSVGNLKLSLTELWHDSLWLDNQRINYAYDSASNLINGLIQNWGDTSWVNLYQESYKYDSARNRISYTGEIWNDSVWVNDQHYTYTYNKFNQLEAGIGENWIDSTGVWDNFEKGQYTYDSYGGIETYLYQQWKTDTIWGNVSLSQYNYDSVGNAYVGNYYVADSTGSWTQNNDGVLQIFYNYGSALAYFTGYQVIIKYNAPLSTGVGDVKDFVLQYRFAPNPAVNHTTIHLGVDSRERVRVNLYSLTGEKLATIFQGELKKGTYRFEISTAQLPSGVYLATLLSGKYTKTIKLVVRK